MFSKFDSLAVFVRRTTRLWSTSYKKDCQRRHLEKQEEDISNLITPEMVTTFEQSESTRRAVPLIGQLSGLTVFNLTKNSTH